MFTEPMVELKATITAFIAADNGSPKPYKWLKSADDIFIPVKRSS